MWDGNNKKMIVEKNNGLANSTLIILARANDVAVLFFSFLQTKKKTLFGLALRESTERVKVYSALNKRMPYKLDQTINYLRRFIQATQMTQCKMNKREITKLNNTV